MGMQGFLLAHRCTLAPAAGWLANRSLAIKIVHYQLAMVHTFGRFSHIYATSKIEIGKKVLMADKVYLSDNLHGHVNVELPVIDQPIEQTKPVIIGDGAWLGENACVIGASVGKNAVVGANSVVTKDIPDYAVAVGAPAYIIKRFDFEYKAMAENR